MRFMAYNSVVLFAHPEKGDNSNYEVRSRADAPQPMPQAFTDL
jgi:hypothetical protein